MQTKNILGIILMSVSLTFMTSCNDKNNTPDDPADVVTLNMLDELNGKTLLGESGVYINKANNFQAQSSVLIADVGSVKGVGAEVAPKLSNLTKQAAVTLGHMYQIFVSEAVFDFPSGVRALQIGAGYYKVYAVSSIMVDTKTTGATVKYVLITPESTDLPKAGHSIGSVSNQWQWTSMKLPKGAECFWESGVSEAFDIRIEDGELRMALRQTPTEYNGLYGSYRIFIRLGDVYTIVLANVVRG